MARRETVEYTDDLDGSPAEGTVRFGLDGAQYEIDLNAEHAEELRALVDHFAQHARRQPAHGARVVPIRRGPAHRDREQSAAMRAWARAQGHNVSDRGKLPDSIVAAWHEAHKATPRATVTLDLPDEPPAEPEPEPSARKRRPSGAARAAAKFKAAGE